MESPQWEYIRDREPGGCAAALAALVCIAGLAMFAWWVLKP